MIRAEFKGGQNKTDWYENVNKFYENNNYARYRPIKRNFKMESKWQKDNNPTKARNTQYKKKTAANRFEPTQWFTTWLQTSACDRWAMRAHDALRPRENRIQILALATWTILARAVTLTSAVYLANQKTLWSESIQAQREFWIQNRTYLDAHEFMHGLG